MFKKFTILSAALFLGACSSGQAMYEWGGYSSHLLAYYKNPQEKAAFAENLLEAINEAEAADKVPPGLYAEYGYMMVEMNNSRDAVIYFTKEKEKWPESAVVMEKLIKRLGG